MPEPAVDHDGFSKERADALARLKEGCESTQVADDKDDKGKAVVDDESVVIDKEMSIGSSSSSSSQETENKSGSCLTDRFSSLTLIPERPAISPAEANAQITVLAVYESDQPGDVIPNSNIAASAAAASKGKRKAEEAKTEAPPKVTKVMSESDAHWHNHEPQPFQDFPELAGISSGLGLHTCMQLMGLPEEPPHPADPTEQVNNELEQFISTPQLLTVRIPTYGFDYVGGGPVLIPVLDELQVEDREELGVEGFLHQDHLMDED